MRVDSETVFMLACELRNIGHKLHDLKTYVAAEEFQVIKLRDIVEKIMEKKTKKSATKTDAKKGCSAGAKKPAKGGTKKGGKK